MTALAIAAVVLGATGLLAWAGWRCGPPATPSSPTAINSNEGTTDMSIFTTSKFWADSAERAVKTAAQSAAPRRTGAGALGVLEVGPGECGFGRCSRHRCLGADVHCVGKKGNPDSASLID